MNMGIKAIKIGDKAIEVIRKQSNLLRIHSVYRNAINFIDGSDYLVAVLTDKHGVSSQSITVSQNDMEILLSCNMEEGNIINMNELIDFNEAEIVYFGQPPEIEFSLDELIAENVKVCIEYLIQYGNLSEFSESILGQDNIYRKYTENILKDLEQRYFNKDMVAVANSLRDFVGLGQGLTPSGDDFICGFVSVLQCCFAFNGLSNNWMSDLWTRVLDGMEDKTTIVSYNMLRSYLRGELSEYVQDFIRSILSGEQSDLVKSFNRILQIGSTSGSDMATGVIFGFYLVLKLGGGV